MPKNYDSGIYYERKTRKLLEDEGFTVIRSAGSKGFADLIAFNTHSVLFVQVKKNSWPGKAERERARETEIPPNAKWVCYRWDKHAKSPRIATLSMFR